MVQISHICQFFNFFWCIVFAILPSCPTNLDQALQVCNDALAIDGESTKALYCRVSMYYEKKNWGEANKDIKKAAKITPNDKAVKKMQERIDAQLKRQKVKEKKMAQKMFG